MVQILRDKTRNYIADQTGAIKTSQIAQNVGEWNQLIQGAAKVGYGVYKDRQDALAQEQAEQNKLNIEWAKESQKADINFINTQVGQQANISAQDIVHKEIAAGTLDPNTEAGKSRINEIFAQQYKSITEARPMQTEAGYTKLAEMQRAGADKALASSYKTFEKKQAETAKALAVQSTKDLGDEAYKQGTLQDFEDLEGKNDYIKYIAKKTGRDPKEVAIDVDKQIGASRLLGVADTDVMTAASALDNEEILRDHFRDIIESDPDSAKWSESKKEKKINELMADRKATTEQDLRDIIGDDYFNSVIKSNKESLEKQKVSLQNEQSKLSKKSPEYKALQKKIDSLKEKIESGDDSDALNQVRSELREQLDPIIKKRYAELKQEKKVAAYNTALDTWINGMSPNLSQATQARWDIFAETNLGKEKNMTHMTEWELQNQSQAQPQMSLLDPFKEEINVDDLASAYQQYVENSSTVKTDMHDTYDGTMAMHDSLQDLLNGDYNTPIQAVKAGYDALNTMYKAPITEDQMGIYSTLVHNAIQDKGFGDMVSKVLNDADRYYPDTSWMSNMIDSNSRRSDIDTVNSFMKSNLKNATDNAMNMMVEASTLPIEQRTPAFQQISDYLIGEKKRIYNDAVAKYGIDLNYLDNELNTKGHAYAQFGFQVKEYKGRLDNGTPIFSDVTTKDINKEIEKYLQMLGEGESKDKSNK